MVRGPFVGAYSGRDISTFTSTYISHRLRFTRPIQLMLGKLAKRASCKGRYLLPSLVKPSVRSWTWTLQNQYRYVSRVGVGTPKMVYSFPFAESYPQKHIHKVFCWSMEQSLSTTLRGVKMFGSQGVLLVWPTPCACWLLQGRFALLVVLLCFCHQMASKKNPTLLRVHTIVQQEVTPMKHVAGPKPGRTRQSCDIQGAANDTKVM